MTIGISKERLEELSSKASRLEDKDFLETLIFQCTELNPWLPIEQAPDDRQILLFYEGIKTVGKWGQKYKYWLDETGFMVEPTHYQELPGDPQ